MMNMFVLKIVNMLGVSKPESQSFISRRHDGDILNQERVFVFCGY